MARHRRRGSLPAAPTKVPQQPVSAPTPQVAPELPTHPAGRLETFPRSVRRDLVLVALWGGGAVGLLVALAILDRLGGGFVSEILAL